MKNPENVRSLNIEQKDAETFLNNVGKFTKLEALDLTINQDLPSDFGQLQEMKMLRIYLANNGTIPSGVGNLKSLRILEISAVTGKLGALPAEIGGLQNLFQLSIQFSQLKSLPPEIGNLKRLRQLVLDE